MCHSVIFFHYCSFLPFSPSFWFSPEAVSLADIFSTLPGRTTVCDPLQSLSIRRATVSHEGSSPVAWPQRLQAKQVSRAAFFSQSRKLSSHVIKVYYADQKKKEKIILTFKSFISVNLHSLKWRARDHRPALHSAFQIPQCMHQRTLPTQLILPLARSGPKVMCADGESGEGF